MDAILEGFAEEDAEAERKSRGDSKAASSGSAGAPGGAKEIKRGKPPAQPASSAHAIRLHCPRHPKETVTLHSHQAGRVFE
jgi:hypothetical protein